MEEGGKAEEKVEGKARTVDKEIKPEDYQSHVEGGVGIGVIPLLEDNNVNFAAIDIDVYKVEDQKKAKLTHSDIALALMETPLIVTKSKSGGIHVWLFSKDGVSARLATDYLNAQAASLGVAGTEVFPKQTERHSDEDIGNWINLPYFGDTRKAVIPVKSGSVVEYIEPDLGVFLDIAEGASTLVTDDFLIEHTTLPPTQRDGEEGTKLWFDGPPCLQTLIVGHPEKVTTIQKKFDRGDITQDQYDKQMGYTQAQLGEGSRNRAFFNVGIYLRRRMNEHDPDVVLDGTGKKDLENALVESHGEWMRLTGHQGIPRELGTLAKQASKGKWGYKCTEEPLKGFCNRRLCLKRKFGVGTGVSDASFAITGLTIVDTEDKQYYMNVGDTRIHVPDVGSLLNQGEFGKIVTNATNRIWTTMQDAKYKQMMDALLQDADVVEGPPDSDRRAVLLNALHEFVHKKKIDRSKSETGIFNGRALWDDEGVEAWFKFDQFTEFLRGKGIQMTNNQVADMLITKFSVQARGNTHVGGRQVRPYVVNIQRLTDLMNGEANGEA
jgi:hypothetical protein